MQRVQVKTSDGVFDFILEKIPDECPVCHYNINPVQVGYFHNEPVTEHAAQVVFRCPRHKCQAIFVGYYRRYEPASYGGDSYFLNGTAPQAPKTYEFPKEIADLSPTFVEVYNQAMAAETRRLTQLSGMGLRRALEFLVKDFLINQDPTKADEIKGKMLGPCIKDHVTDENIKDCAQRATWLGNDETHYVRKWEDKDVKDLKMLVELTKSWIQTVLLTKKFKKEMPKGK